MKPVYLFIVVIVAFAVLPARAEDTPTQCTEVEKGYTEAIMYSTTRQGQLAKESMPLLKQMGELNDLAKEPNVPIGKQLTPEQLDEFQKLRAQLIYLQSQMFVASSRERDMSMLYHLCLASAESENLMESHIADSSDLPESKWLEAEYDKSPNKLYLQILDQLQRLFPPEYLKQMQQLQKQGTGAGNN